MLPLTWVNGQEQDTITVTDRGFLYGDGVWETIAVCRFQAQLLDKHLARLQRGLDCLAIKYFDHSDSLQNLAERIKRIAAMTETAVLKLMISRGSGQRGYNPASAQHCTEVIQLSPENPQPPLQQHPGITLGFCQDIQLARQPRLAGIKHANRLEQVLIRAAFQPSWQEALVCDTLGDVIEGSMSNVFVVTPAGKVITPDLTNSGVAGVMREYVMEQLAIMGIDCQVTSFKIDQVQTAHSLFMTNALIGLWPVTRFEGHSLARPEWLSALQKTIQQVV